jgi:hypothetical protein
MVRDSRQDWVPTSQDLINDNLSLAHVVWWKAKYNFKVKYLGRLISATVVVLSGVELFGPFTHISDELGRLVPVPWIEHVPASVINTWHSRGFHAVLALFLFAAAVVMLLHHRFLEKQTERYRELLAFMLLTAKTIRDLKELSQQELTQPRAAVLLLDNLISALDAHHLEPKLNASILVRTNGTDEPFRIYAQDSDNAFDPDLDIPRDNTVAGRIVEYERKEKSPGTLLYIPRTKFVHGIVFRGGDVFFRENAICTTPYQVLDETTERDVLKCLLCVQIPLKRPIKQSIGQRKNLRRESYPIAVLSLSAPHEDCMDSFHYLGARLAADLCAQLLMTRE